jgi:hypothetical protein
MLVITQGTVIARSITRREDKKAQIQVQAGEAGAARETFNYPNETLMVADRSQGTSSSSSRRWCVIRRSTCRCSAGADPMITSVIVSGGGGLLM